MSKLKIQLMKDFVNMNNEVKSQGQKTQPSLAHKLSDKI